jgi:uncharacterized protein YbjT (DUF2867 family)
MKEVLVIGGTGAMGRPVVEQLLASRRERWAVRVLTRDPSCPEAQALVALAPDRVRIFAGSARDPEALERATAGAYGVFCNTNFFATASVRGEVEEGLAALDAARRADVKHFVWSSLDSLGAASAGRYPVPHFDAKAAVAARIDERRADEFMRRGFGDPSEGTFHLERTTVLVTLPYLENVKAFFRPWPGTLPDGRSGMIFRLPFGDARWPWVALDDIATFAVRVFEDPATWGGRTLPIASDILGGAEIAATFERVTGIPAAYVPMSMEEYEQLPIPMKHDFVNMVKALNEFPPARDLAFLRTIHSEPVTFEAWLRKSGWRGEPDVFMKSARG